MATSARRSAPAKKAARPSKSNQRGGAAVARRAHNPEVAGSTPAPASTGRKRHDWAAVERDYRTGKFTLKELQAKHGPGYADISRRAKRDGWTQDLSGAVRQATRAAVIAETVKQRSAKIAEQTQTEATKEAQTATTNAVLAAAEIGKDVILRHRGDLMTARTVALDLLDELRAVRFDDDERELLAEILAGEGAKPEDRNRARLAVHRALGVPTRIGGIKALAEAITKLHAGERKAFGLDDEGEDDPEDKAALSKLVSQVHNGGSLLPIAPARRPDK